MLGDSITTDHISPAGNIPAASPAGQVADRAGRREEGLQLVRRAPRQPRGDDARHLRQHPPAQRAGAGHRGRLDGHGARRRRRVHLRRGDGVREGSGTPLVIVAGKEYGTGSSRDWAAKGTVLLGVRAVIAESFERIHRSNLVGMGVLPLEFTGGDTRQSLGLTGFETFDIDGLDDSLAPRRDAHREGHGARTARRSVHGALPHRHAGGAQLLQERRHPALRAALARAEVARGGVQVTRGVHRHGGRPSYVRAVPPTCCTSA